MKELLPQLFGERISYRLSEEANPDFCHKCHHAIWVLICGVGFKTKLDTTPLNPETMLESYLGQVRTFDCTRQGKSFAADYRNSMRIQAGMKRMVLAEHQCGSKLATQIGRAHV